MAKSCRQCNQAFEITDGDGPSSAKSPSVPSALSSKNSNSSVSMACLSPDATLTNGIWTVWPFVIPASSLTRPVPSAPPPSPPPTPPIDLRPSIANPVISRRCIEAGGDTLKAIGLRLLADSGFVHRKLSSESEVGSGDESVTYYGPVPVPPGDVQGGEGNVCEEGYGLLHVR